MRSPCRLAVPALLLALTAQGATLTLAPLAADKGKAIGRQLTASLCKRFECVKPNKRPAIVLTGKVSAARVDVVVVFPGKKGAETVKRSLGIKKKKLVTADADALADAISSAIETQAAPPPAEPSPEPAPASEPAATKAPEPAPAPAKKEQQEVVEQPAPRPHPRGGEAPMLVVSAGADLVGRNLSYKNLTAGALYPYQLSLGAAPRVAAEVYPLAHISDGMLQRLGVTAEGTVALGWASKTNAPGTQLSYPTSMSRFDIGALMWLGSPTISVAPEFALRLFNFSTGNASNGTAFTVLPNVSYSALRLGAALRFVTGELVTLELGGGVMPVLGASSLIGSTYFTRGSGLAFEIEGGAWVHFTPHLGLAVLGDFTQYGFSFTSAATDTYRADGASDSQYGVRLMGVFTL